MMTTLSCSTGDGNHLLTSGGYYATHYCTQWPCAICNPPSWNPPVYIQPTYVPYPVYYPQVGTIVFAPDTELKEEVKQLKDEIVKLRKELQRK